LKDCHGLPRRERRRHAAQLRALSEAHDVSALFPSVRPRDPVALAYAEQTAPTLDPHDQHIPTGAVERGVALLDEKGATPDRGRLGARTPRELGRPVPGGG
jgi:hypothetical protein